AESLTPKPGIREQNLPKPDSCTATNNILFDHPARASSVGGTVRPSAFGLVRFMTISNFVGCAVTLLYHFPELVQRAQLVRPWLLSEGCGPVGPRPLADKEVAAAVHRKPMRRKDLGGTKARAKPA